jgi:exosome complex component RRP42
MINEKLKAHAEAAIEAGVRRDGRKLDEFRSISIEQGISSTAHGSARIQVGDSVVVAGVKMEVGKPYPDSPDAGSLMVNAELLPLSNPVYESGPPSIESIEVSRVVDRSIRESKAIDMKELSIVSGESMWIAAVDIAPINADGNLIDISNLVAMAALRNTRMPTLNENNVPNYELLTENQLPIQRTPILVTVFKMGKAFLVDPTQEEEEYCDARLSMSFQDDETLCALQKGGEAPLTISDIEEMIELGKRVSKQLRAQVE